MRLFVIIPLFGAIALAGCVVLPIPHTTERTPKIIGRTLDLQTRRPIAGASVQLANLPKQAALTGSDGHFILNATHYFHLIYYANPSFVMHFPYADSPNGWLGALRITHDGYKPLSVKASKDGRAERPVDFGDVYVQPQHK